jgi:hypothetical protein
VRWRGRKGGREERERDKEQYFLVSCFFMI